MCIVLNLKSFLKTGHALTIPHLPHLSIPSLIRLKHPNSTISNQNLATSKAIRKVTHRKNLPLHCPTVNHYFAVVIQSKGSVCVTIVAKLLAVQIWGTRLLRARSRRLQNSVRFSIRALLRVLAPKVATSVEAITNEAADLWQNQKSNRQYRVELFDSRCGWPCVSKFCWGLWWSNGSGPDHGAWLLWNQAKNANFYN